MEIISMREAATAVRKYEQEAWDEAIDLDPSDPNYDLAWTRWFMQKENLSQGVALMVLIERLSGEEN